MPGEKVGTSWRMQALVSTICFVVWAYATKGSMFLTYSEGLFGGQAYNGQIAAAVLIIFTLVSGLFHPGSQEESV
jgi:hypothetical protein